MRMELCWDTSTLATSFPTSSRDRPGATSPLCRSSQASKGLSTTRKHFDLRILLEDQHSVSYDVKLYVYRYIHIYICIDVLVCYHSEHSANPWHSREVTSSHQRLQYRIVPRYKLSWMDTPKSGSRAHPLVAVLIEYLECG